MTTSSTPTKAEAGPGLSRRSALGLAAIGGVAATNLGQAAIATAAPSSPGITPALPTKISEIASSLELQSSAEWHLARRVCPAPTASIAAGIARVGYAAWIDRQLDWKSIDDKLANKLVKKYLSFATMTGAQVVKASKNEGWRAGKAMSVSRTVRHVFTKRYLYESMVDTLADQVYVSADGKAAHLAAWFDWAVLRKYALSKYSTLLSKATRHPAMLIYLDNHLNSKDNPNENLGRELLELHTVGVGNYNENDVRQAALLLTGHSYDHKKKTYVFRPSEHHVGPLTVMGVTYPNATAEGGPATLTAFLDDLAHHQATATRIARRLAVRYVSDNPAEALVSRLAKVYLDNDTSLKAVIRALLLSDEFAASVGAKWRRPQESIATMVKLRRPYRIKPKSTQLKNLWAITDSVQWMLYREGHQARMWPVVDGYPDQASDWISTGAMLAHWFSANARVNWGNDKEWPSKYSNWAKALKVKRGQPIAEVATRLTQELTGYTWSSEHLDIVIARLKGSDDNTALTANQLKQNLPLALHFIFCSPYFMLR